MMTTLFKCQVHSDEKPKYVQEVRMTSSDGYHKYVPEVRMPSSDVYPEYVPEIRMTSSYDVMNSSTIITAFRL